MVHHDDDDARVVQEDLKETESEPTLEEMELVTHGVGVDVDVEWKPLRENESQTIQVGIGCVLQEHAEKTILGDLVGLVNIEEEEEEKPLRERVSQACVDAAEKIVLEEENAEGTGLDLEEMELVIEDEEKPLRERVSQVVEQEENADLEQELRDCGLGGENAVPVSEQTVASELLPPCKPNNTAAEEGNLYEYLWATQYQPMNLQDFICNRDTALHLKALVRKLILYSFYPTH